MRCSIHQPQFLVWLGYLHKIRVSDVFVFLDNVQFKKNEFQNRNRLRTPDGSQWVTVPVSFRFGDTIRETRIAANVPWRRKVWRSIEQNYAKAPFFKEYGPGLGHLLERPYADLAELNRATVLWLMQCFEIGTRTVVASQLPPMSENPTGRLVDLCRRLGADVYLSGAGGKGYLEVSQFDARGLRVEFQDFLHPQYPQCYSAAGFVSHLSAIDGLFNCGGGAQGRRALNLDSPACPDPVSKTV